MTRQPGDPKITAAVGERLRQRREEKNVSQEQLAELAGVDRGYVSLVERGKVNPTVTTLVRLASSLEMNPGDLLDGLTV